MHMAGLREVAGILRALEEKWQASAQNCGNGIYWDTCAECNLVSNWSSVDRPAPKALHGKEPCELLNLGQNSNKKPLERDESLSPITAQGSQRNSNHSVEQAEKARGDGHDNTDDQVDDEVVQQAFSYDVDKAEHVGMPIELPG